MSRILIVPYNISWPDMFLLEQTKIQNILGNECVYIEHIGSTSIINIRAKPIIDILVAVKDINNINKLNTKFAKLDYIAKGEFGIAGRRFFIKTQEYHIHIFAQNSLELQRHLDFRNYMRLHKDAALEYASLKTKLALRFPNDINAYCLGKDTFIKNIDQKAHAFYCR